MLKQKPDAVLHAFVIEPTGLLDLAQVVNEKHGPADYHLSREGDEQTMGQWEKGDGTMG